MREAMPRLAVIEPWTPERTRTETCEKHGEYVSEWHRNANAKGPEDGWWGGCNACREEMIAERDERERQRRTAEQERQRERTFERVGIVPRYRTKSFDTFEADTAEQQRVLATVRKYAEGCPKNGRSLILSGSVGTGKSHLASAVALDVMARGYSVRVVTVHGFVLRLHDTWRKDSEEREREVYEELAGCDLLVLDEVGASIGGDRELSELFALLNARYNFLKPTIICTNLDMPGLKAALGERVVDRLREGGGQIVVFTGPSWRARQ